MTTIALLSDEHANLPALEALLADLDARGSEEVDVVYCLGDLVGYAPWPNEVIEAVRQRRIPTIAGNYDEGVGLGSVDCGCAYQTEEDERHGAASVAFTNEAILDENRRYLRGLPRYVRLALCTPRDEEAETLSVLLVHGSPRRINEYLFEDRPDRSFLRMMEAEDADVLCFGHTHKPFHKTLRYAAGRGHRFRHAINIGSVGKPKDGDPRACYVLLHLDPEAPAQSPDRVRPEHVRVEYDVERAARAIEEGPLPDAFAQMLREAE